MFRERVCINLMEIAFQPLGKEASCCGTKTSMVFLSDTHGNLIMLNDLGIDIYDLETKKVRYMGEEVGIQRHEAKLKCID